MKMLLVVLPLFRLILKKVGLGLGWENGNKNGDEE
jgi:hypothetical protein